MIMANFVKSKSLAWCALILTVALIVLAFIAHTPWWGFIAIFFLFVGIFAHIASLYLSKINQIIGNKLENCALVLITLALVAFIVEYFIFNFNFGL